MRRKTIEEYIEVIYDLQEKDGQALTGSIAAEMNVKPPSVTEILKKLEQKGLVSYQAHCGATLTGPGTKLAQCLSEKHRVIAEFLMLIGVDEKVAQKDACQMEHHVSEQSVQTIGEFVAFLVSEEEGALVLSRFEQFREDS
jgi:DtxR family Mn-dependent transcriptional regulator